MMASRICCIYTRGRELRYVREDISTKGKRHLPLELYRVLCERRQGRDDQRPSRTADPESIAHNWPTVESVNQLNKKRDNFLVLTNTTTTSSFSN